MISSRAGDAPAPLGLSAHPRQDAACVPRALDAGINYFFFYSASHEEFVAALRPLLCERRDEMIIATGSGARTLRGLRSAQRRLTAALDVEVIDVFFAEYVHPGDDAASIFGEGGVLEELQRWKQDGRIRFVGATAHDRGLARRLAEDGRVDLLMHRFNMAHRKAVVEVFPAAMAARTPVVAFTATRWGTLLEPQADWPGSPPRAADCYRYCLAQPAVQIVLTAAQSLEELNENLSVLRMPGMSGAELETWERFGDLVYSRERGADPFESR